MKKITRVIKDLKWKDLASSHIVLLSSGVIVENNDFFSSRKDLSRKEEKRFRNLFFAS